MSSRFASANSRSSAQTFNIAPTSSPEQPHPVSVGLRQALNVESSEVTGLLLPTRGLNLATLVAKFNPRPISHHLQRNPGRNFQQPGSEGACID
jgi:hypothetical protein